MVLAIFLLASTATTQCDESCTFLMCSEAMCADCEDCAVGTYTAYSTPETWADAKANCEANGGHLPLILNAAQATAVRNAANNAGFTSNSIFACASRNQRTSVVSTGSPQISGFADASFEALSMRSGSDSVSAGMAVFGSLEGSKRGASCFAA